MIIDPLTIDLEVLPFVSLDQRRNLPKVPSIYFVIDANGRVQYIGKSVNPKQRWTGHHRFDEVSKLAGVKIAYLHCDRTLLTEIEIALITWFKPPLNRCESIGRQVGFSPINGEGGAMVKGRAAWSMAQEDWDWLRSQPNQSEYLRLLIQKDRLRD